MAVAAPPEPGRTLDTSNADDAASLLPPELLAHYEDGTYRNKVAAWPSTPPWEPAFAAASAQNAGKLDVDAKGSIVMREGNAPARGVYGLPFAIKADDPNAGVKTIWNAYYSFWRIGSSHDLLALDWVGKSSLERQAQLESQILFFEGVEPKRAPKDNPLDVATQARAVVSSPADLNGTATLAWRFRDGAKRDQAWTYVPALRRVRQVSPANRSDGFLGSDLSQDDGAFFDGKPEDFTWKLVGEREGFVLVDPASLTGSAKRKGLPNGGIVEEWEPGQKVAGYQDPDWKGVAWAPVAPVLVKRKLWVVEATPKDPYYLFAKVEIALDQETFAGTITRKFDAQGALLRTLQFLSYASSPIEAGGESLILPASSMGFILAENQKAGRATIAGTAPPGESVHERRIPIDPGVFSLDRLGATGK
jgi:hypothetical protein